MPAGAILRIPAAETLTFIMRVMLLIGALEVALPRCWFQREQKNKIHSVYY